MIIKQNINFITTFGGNICIYMYVYTNIYACVYIHTTHIYKHECIHMCMYMWTYTHVCEYSFQFQTHPSMCICVGGVGLTS